MKINEFPKSIASSQRLIEELANQIEQETDREKRRELFLLKIELRDHIIRIGQKIGKIKH